MPERVYKITVDRHRLPPQRVRAPRPHRCRAGDDSERGIGGLSSQRRAQR